MTYYVNTVRDGNKLRVFVYEKMPGDSEFYFRVSAESQRDAAMKVASTFRLAVPRTEKV